MAVYPKDINARKINTRSRSIFVYQLDSSCWEWHEQTGTDHGTDAVIELIENDEYRGKKIELQVKGTQSIDFLKDGQISFDMDVKTVNYALGCSCPFVLILVDVVNEVVYFKPIQDYFIECPELIDKAEKNNTSIAIHIDPEMRLDVQGNELITIAQRSYKRRKSGTIIYIED